MAKEIIDEVVSSKAIEQFKELFSHMVAVETKMQSLIEVVEKSRSTFQSATGFRKINEEYINLYNSTEKLKQSGVERLDIERQIKASGEKMAQAVNVQAEAIDSLRAKNEKLARTEVQIIAKIQEKQIRLKEIDKTLKNTEGLEKYSKDLGVETGNLKIEQAQLKSEVSDLNLEFKRQIESQKYAEDSMKGMSVTLNKFKTQYAQLSEEGRNSEFGIEMANQINILDEKLKGLDKSIGVNNRNVGNYEVSQKTLKTQLREIVDELGMHNLNYEKLENTIKAQRREVQELARTKGIESQEYKEANIRLTEAEQKYRETGMAMNQLQKDGGKLKDIMRGTNEEIGRAGEGEMGVMALQQGVGALADTYSAFQAGMVSLGFESEELMETYAKMMLIQQGVAGITGISNALQKESMLMLQLKAIRQKVVLIFTQKQVGATVAESVAEQVNTATKIENAAATTGAAVATGGLTAAEGVATTATWTLTGSLKAAGLAIKSIPVIGWILAAVAALGTLTVLLYKHLSAEKELNAEQQKRKQLSKDLTEINQKVNESTLENITRVRLLQKELPKVAKGSKEWQGIVKEINTLTGSQLDTIKATPKQIEKATQVWIEQYKIRAKAEATIQKIVQSELEFEKLALDVQTAKASDRKEMIDKLPLLKEEKEELLKQLNIMKGTFLMTQDNVDANAQVMKYIGIARTKMLENNQVLEKQISLTGLLPDETKKTNKEVEKTKDLYIDILKIKANLFYTGEDLINKNTEIELEQERLKYEDEKKRLKDHKKELEQLEEKHQLENYRIRLNGETLIQELRQKTFNAEIDNKIKLDEERQAALTDFVDRAKLSQNTALDFTSKFLQDQWDSWEKEKQINQQRVDAISGLISEFGFLGNAITSNIKDEEKRIIVQQRVAQIELLVTKGLAIAQILLDKGGDPYTKIIRVAANLAAVIGGFIQAQSAINQAKGYEHGTSYHTGGDAVVSEGVDGSGKFKPEVVEANGKKYYFDKPTLLKDLPIGAKVKPISNMVDNYFNYQNTTKDERVVELLQSIADKSFVKIDVGENVYSHIVKGASQTRILNTQFKH